MTEQERNPEELSPDQMRAAPGTGRQDGEPTEMTTWDGAGNPIKHVFTDDESGHLSEGTGPKTEEAKKDASDPSHMLGQDASPEMGEGGSRSAGKSTPS
ncbi:hypothetical protein BH24ACT1_BH24ACT1_03720 [soil metagenome]